MARWTKEALAERFPVGKCFKLRRDFAAPHPRGTYWYSAGNTVRVQGTWLASYSRAFVVVGPQWDEGLLSDYPRAEVRPSELAPAEDED
ncbi:MAG: hypothetical protein AUJ75_03935 [Candidatus Omnitrophica bacterium CG1_02_49_10]|nr:MAG: hypothetical protein AUJ75_03935 [Candidatus Omnitrophica bacterium CG1_02_49_10]